VGPLPIIIQTFGLSRVNPRPLPSPRFKSRPFPAFPAGGGHVSVILPGETGRPAQNRPAAQLMATRAQTRETEQESSK
jgi:hypothetical protein